MQNYWNEVMKCFFKKYVGDVEINNCLNSGMITYLFQQRRVIFNALMIDIITDIKISILIFHNKIMSLNINLLVKVNKNKENKIKILKNDFY